MAACVTRSWDSVTWARGSRVACWTRASSSAFTIATAVLNGSFDTGFSLDLGLKDLEFVSALGDEHGITLGLTELVRQRFLDTRQRYGGAAWPANVVRMMEHAAGVELRADGLADVIDRG